jgi:hypothetical protein
MSALEELYLSIDRLDHSHTSNNSDRAQWK